MSLGQIIPVILCGGSGRRLWPLSRENHPKQFLKLFNKYSFLQRTALRAMMVSGAPANNVITVTLERFTAQVAAQYQNLEGGLQAHIVSEPVARNTAAAIAKAALYAEAHFGPENMLWVLPADHHIGRELELARALDKALEAACGDRLVTFGIRPSRPDPNYGYIKIGAEYRGGLYEVAQFTEKPSVEMAAGYLQAGGYLWNSGMFVFRVSAVLQAFRDHAPEILQMQDYAALPGLPFDRAVLEKASNVAVVPCDPGWSDIGSWKSLFEFGFRRKLAACLCVMFLMTACADMGMGKAAYKEGDYRQAEKHLAVLAYSYDLPEAQLNLARIYKRKNQPEIYGAEIIQLLEKAKENGEAAAPYELARLYEEGYGVPADRDRAERYYEQAYKAGYERAGNGLLTIKAQKAQEAGDYKLAMRCWSELVAAGDQGAAIELAGLYEQITQKGEYDLQIIGLLKNAGDARGGRAYFELGRLYDEGNLYQVFHNGAQAEYYYTKAANAGYWRADFYRARLYEQGELVPADRDKAIALYKQIWEQHQYERAQDALVKLGAA